MAEVLLHPAMSAVQAAEWCAAHRAKISIVHIPGQRGRIIASPDVPLPAVRELSTGFGRMPWHQP